MAITSKKPVSPKSELRGDPMTTPWTQAVDHDHPWPEYPRPQMVRPYWINLNGQWDYAISPKEQDQPKELMGKILVPFPVESILSGVQQVVGPDQRLWYRRHFQTPNLPADGRLLLHFGAVDFEARVFVNGQFVGEHRGGNVAFWFDITPFTHAESGDRNEIVVSVWDPTDMGCQPHGKQTLHPESIWYTAVTGIWQTVWLEPVPPAFIERLKLTPDVDAGVLRICVVGSHSANGLTVEAVVKNGTQTPDMAQGTVGQEFSITLPNPALWSPDKPFLYDLVLRLKKGDQTLDEVSTYFGMRKIEVKEATDGFLRICLNGKSLFHYGVLDQGWWPDGLLTAPTDQALRFDLETIKRLGMNMCRKHVKIEPARWYYWADMLGILVWQDMPSGGIKSSHHVEPACPTDAQYTPAEKNQFIAELQGMLDTLHNAPSIVVWAPFNEGWGQHETNWVLQWVKQYDPSRLVDGPSGWEDRGWGDLLDRHSYANPDMFPHQPGRASVLGEFGGLGLAVPEHLWWKKKNWAYRDMRSQKELQSRYEQLMHDLRAFTERGLAAAVYTQLTDVEGEINGIMTYDRKVMKLNAEKLENLHRKLIGG